MANYLDEKLAEKFIHETLRLNVSTSDTNKEELLFKIVSRFMATVPFHNIEIMAQPLGQRSIPSIKESIQYVLDGVGGTCNVLNTFMYFLLKVLKFDVYVAMSSVKKPGKNNHIILIVQNLIKPADKWLVDVGFGNPCFEPIKLDFEEESPTYKQSYLTFKYVKRESTYIQFQKITSAKTFPFVENGWAHAYYFTTDEVDLNLVLDSIERNVHKNYDPYNWFQYSPRVFGYQLDGKAVLFRDGFLYKENEHGTLSKEPVNGDTVEELHKLFPVISKAALKKALTNSEL